MLIQLYRFIRRIVDGYRIQELLDLAERGLVTQFSEPLNMDYWKDIEIYKSMTATAEAAGSPWVATHNGDGRWVLWKENKALRCKLCKSFLGVRPPRYKRGLTHKQLGLECAEWNESDHLPTPY